ncbi:MAG: PAS/PAC sensor signal transduction histidine kinase [Candidatus Saganbacteria bacterium]|uniref:histidine kinase n=1 Tax=Candidatus Saganbacteria bacterium TaxID=2575572 RepID=A0A833L4W5_UNCSA|nr:MAG: PAS/PAC sensor signal transduction histidine kinase [Candidatus Saganbacteria bacterium]
MSKQDIYVRVKWLMIAASMPFYLFGSFWGGIKPPAVYAIGFLFLISFINNLILQLFAKRKFADYFIYWTLMIDAALSIQAVYFSGSIETGLIFLPSIFIFISGFIFSPMATIFYGLSMFLAMVSTFYMEYFGYIPHFGHSIKFASEYLWMQVPFFMDILAGIFMLYMFSAFASGYLNQIVKENLIRMKNSVREMNNAKKMSDEANLALTKSKEELEKSEQMRVRELVELRASLEQKMLLRTVELEENRRAILHMMKDLKDDVNKMQELDRMKDEFISNVSHELRTPLTPLIDYASILAEGLVGSANEKQKEIYNSMLRLSKREVILINSLLEVSHLKSGSMAINKVPLELKQIVVDAVKDFTKEAGDRKINLSAEENGNIPTVMGDENLIARLVSQLISNALKFTPEAGWIRVKVFVENNHVRVEIEDNGIGIAKENINKIFHKFYQVDSGYSRKYGGMGLGLAICQQIVSLHNGKIWVESPGLGKGAKFVFALPI